MSFEQLQEVIQAEAKRQVSRINDQYDQEFTAEEKRIQEKARRIEEQIITSAEKEGQLEAQRLHQNAHLKARAEVLLAKQSELEEAQTRAKKALLDWSEAERTKLIKLLVNMLEETDGEVYAGELDEAIVRKVAAERGLTVNAETIKSEGGLIYKADKVEINLTTGALLKQVFDQQRAEVAKILFQ